MYYGRKKGIIIAIIIVILVLVLAIGGVCVYMFTDLFKSEKTLFWKYMDSGLGSIKMSENIQLKEIQKKKEQSPYTTNSELTLSSTNENINNRLEKLKLSIEAQTSKTDNYSQINSKVEYANTTIFNLDYLQDEDIYALKSDEIVTVYLGIRNENLKVLFQKLGLNYVTNIPNEVSIINYASLVEFSEQELEHIKETYAKVIEESITDDSYSKQTGAIIEKDNVSYKTTSYRLDLNEEQISNILLKILNTLKTDSITLNLITTKAKSLDLEEKYTTIDGINTVIDDIITNVERTNYKDVSFVVYSYKGETIATEILVKNESKTTIYNSDKSTKIVYTILNSSEELMLGGEYNTISVELSNNTTSTLSNTSIKVNIDDDKEALLEITNTGSASQGTLDTNAILTIINNDEVTELYYNQTTEFVNELEDMQELNETNCAILNDYTQEDLNNLMQAIINQVALVYNQKMEMLGFETVNTTIQQ